MTVPSANFALSLALGLIAGLADYLGGFILIHRTPSARTLRYFVALGAGFMVAAALLEMLPEGLRVNPRWAPLLILAGYCAVHLLEHTLVPHIHFGQPSATYSFLSSKASYSVLLGLAMHTFFDGVAIGSGFVLSRWLGWVLFTAVLLHKIPEGFTVASVMLAGGQTRGTALNSALLLGSTTVAGVLAISLAPSLVKAGLPLSAGVTLYAAATNLMPEVNRDSNREAAFPMAAMFFGGVGLFFLLRTLALAY